MTIRELIKRLQAEDGACEAFVAERPGGGCPLQIKCVETDDETGDAIIVGDNEGT